MERTPKDAVQYAWNIYSNVDKYTLYTHNIMCVVYWQYLQHIMYFKKDSYSYLLNDCQ